MRLDTYYKVESQSPIPLLIYFSGRYHVCISFVSKFVLNEYLLSIDKHTIELVREKLEKKWTLFEW